MNWADGSSSTFLAAWLRHNAPAHTQGDNGQKLLSAFSHLDDTIASTRLSEDGHTVVVHWTMSSTPTEFPVQWLHLHDYSSESSEAVRPRCRGHIRHASLSRTARRRRTCCPSP